MFGRACTASAARHHSHPTHTPFSQIITPLLRSLEKMHALKLLHRDIKPENIFLTALGKFRLGDFGLAIKFDEEIPFSRSGTLDYMAPEVCSSALPAALHGALPWRTRRRLQVSRIISQPHHTRPATLCP